MRIFYMTKLLFILFVAVFSNALLAEQLATVTVDRAWGLLLGDEVQLQITLPTTEEIDQSTLPQVDKRYGTWLYLKGLELNEQQLLLTYQVFNVPANNISITSPELNIRQLNDEWIVIPAMPLTIGSLLATTDELATIVAKVDHAPVLLAIENSKQQLTLFVGLMVLSSLILVWWHFGWKPRNRQAFAQAVYELSRLKWQRSTDPNQATRILHAAFNRTAGTIVVHGELNYVLEQTSWLKPLQQEIEDFYQHSTNHFFIRDAEQEPDFETVKKLAKACRAKEKLA